VDDAATEGEAEVLDRFLFFSASMRFCNSSFDTFMILRMAEVNRANSGLSGGFFIAHPLRI
jgi:hypothetical protein